jgi:transposase
VETVRRLFRRFPTEGWEAVRHEALWPAPDFERRRMVEETLVVVLDSASLHVNHVVKAARARLRHEGTHLYTLPPYSPELNRIEPYLGAVKYNKMPERSP